MTEPDIQIGAENTQPEVSTNKRIRQTTWIVIGVLAVFLLGLGSGYLKWGQDDTAELKQQKELAPLYKQVNPKDGYSLPVFI